MRNKRVFKRRAQSLARTMPPSCLAGCFGRLADRRDEFHTPGPWASRGVGRHSGAAGSPSSWTPASGGRADGFSSPNAGSVASSVCSFYSAQSRYTDAHDDVDGADSAPPPGALASIRRLLTFVAENDDGAHTPPPPAVAGAAVTAAGSEASEGTVIPATPSRVVVGMDADHDAASIDGPPSPRPVVPGEAEEGAATPAMTAPSASAVASHPLNVDEEEEGEAVDEAISAPPPALIPALQAAPSGDAPATVAATPLDLSTKALSPVRAAAAPGAGTPPSPPVTGMWGRVFGGKAAPVAAERAAAAAASKPAAALAAPAAPVAVTEMTAAGPAGASAAGATTPPRKGRLFGW